MKVPCPRTRIDQDDLKYCVEGELTIRVFEDSYGDANVIGGICNFLDAEIEEQTCACELTPDETEGLLSEAVADFKYGDTAP